MQMTMSCAEESRAVSEMLAGTFKPADTFFLIESNLPDYGGWGGSAVKAASRSGEFAPILRHLQMTPRAKILFIRRPRGDAKNFYIALTNQTDPKIYHVALAEYADLLELEIASLTEEGAPRIGDCEMTEIDELYTVCTNGRHDPCCAAFGAPVYQALADYAGAELVWQTTHIGGHRMAATLIAFPAGIVYGHLDPRDVESLVMNHRAGFMLTHKYRGRGCYAGHELDEAAHLAAGAAEALVREKTLKYGVDDLQLTEVNVLGDGQRRVTFNDGNGATFTAEVNTGMSAPRQTSCGDDPKPMPQHDVLLMATT
ncbi:MAG: hypothetical protein F4X87_07155 [Chloroflexi bacterium]|nr:hypothetical protein [Chloroflexota bacterium]